MRVRATDLSLVVGLVLFPAAVPAATVCVAVKFSFCVVTKGEEPQGGGVKPPPWGSLNNSHDAAPTARDDDESPDHDIRWSPSNTVITNWG